MGEILDEQLNVAISSRAKATLDLIRKNHRYLPAQVARGLLDSLCEFYEAHNYFAFPVSIEPMDWKKKWGVKASDVLVAAEPGQAGYGLTPALDLPVMEDQAKRGLPSQAQMPRPRAKHRRPRP